MEEYGRNYFFVRIFLLDLSLNNPQFTCLGGAWLTSKPHATSGMETVLRDGLTELPCCVW